MQKKYILSLLISIIISGHTSIDLKADNETATGALGLGILGAGVGGIIGGGRGAGIGAAVGVGTGLLVGSSAENERRRRRRYYYDKRPVKVIHHYHYSTAEYEPETDPNVIYEQEEEPAVDQVHYRRTSGRTGMRKKLRD